MADELWMPQPIRVQSESIVLLESRQRMSELRCAWLEMVAIAEKKERNRLCTAGTGISWVDGCTSH